MVSIMAPVNMGATMTRPDKGRSNHLVQTELMGFYAARASFLVAIADDFRGAGHVDLFAPQATIGEGRSAFFPGDWRLRRVKSGKLLSQLFELWHVIEDDIWIVGIAFKKVLMILLGWIEAL